MEQPPLIDVEPENEGKSKLSGCAGCLGRLIPITAGLLLLSILLMAGALFLWGGDIERKEKSESVEGEKTGIAGVMEKVKRAVKGEKEEPEVGEEAVVTGEGEAGAAAGQGGAVSAEQAMANAVENSTELAEAAGAEGKSPEERNRLLKEKFGHLEENRPESGSGEGVDFAQAAGGGGAGGGSAAGGQAGGQDRQGGELPEFGEGGKGGERSGIKREPRGGSFGSSTGTAVAVSPQSRYQRWRGDFSTSGSDLEFEVIYQEAGGQLQFRCFVMPYDARTAKLFRRDKGDFLLSFHDEAGERLVPAKGELSVPLTKMTAFEAGGKVSGWVARGMIPLEGRQLSDLKTVRLGWDFDQELSDWLKQLKAGRGK